MNLIQAQLESLSSLAQAVTAHGFRFGGTCWAGPEGGCQAVTSISVLMLKTEVLDAQGGFRLGQILLPSQHSFLKFLKGNVWPPLPPPKKNHTKRS